MKHFQDKSYLHQIGTMYGDSHTHAFLLFASHYEVGRLFDEHEILRNPLTIFFLITPWLWILRLRMEGNLHFAVVG